jgi:hypothetical protein
MDEYYEILDSNLTPKKLETSMRALIKKDPYFLDPYAILIELLVERGEEEEAIDLMAKSMDNALALILDKHGRWPDKMEWGWLENRHIMRILARGAANFWAFGHTEMALEILRDLLRACPNDNLGVRYHISAIREGMTAEEFQRRFESGMFVSSELEPWFIECIKKYPDEFEAWEKAMEY